MRMEVGLTEKRKLRDILIDADIAVGVVVRYAWATLYGDAGMQRLFSVEALTELSWEPLYFKLMSKWLTKLKMGRI